MFVFVLGLFPFEFCSCAGGGRGFRFALGEVGGVGAEEDSVEGGVRVGIGLRFGVGWEGVGWVLGVAGMRW